MGLGFIPVVGSIGSILVTYPLYMGFAIVAHRIHNQQSFEFQDFFKGFEDFVQLFLVYLIIILIAIVIMIPLGIMAFVGMDMTTSLEYGEIPDFFSNGTFVLVFFLVMVPMIYLMTAWRWAPYLVVFYKYSFWDALETSRRLVSRNFWITLGFIVVIGLLAVAGMVALFIGMVVTVPMAMCVEYAAFADITQLAGERDAQQGDIIDHMVE